MAATVVRRHAARRGVASHPRTTGTACPAGATATPVRQPECDDASFVGLRGGEHREQPGPHGRLELGRRSGQPRSRPAAPARRAAPAAVRCTRTTRRSTGSRSRRISAAASSRSSTGVIVAGLSPTRAARSRCDGASPVSRAASTAAAVGVRPCRAASRRWCRATAAPIRGRSISSGPMSTGALASRCSTSGPYVVEWCGRVPFGNERSESTSGRPRRRAGCSGDLSSGDPAPTTAPTTDSPSTARSETSAGVATRRRADCIARASTPPPGLRLLRYEPAAESRPGRRASAPAGRGRRPSSSLSPTRPTPRALRRRAEQVLRLTLEVLDGRRPVAQLAGHLEPRALRYVRAAVAQRPRRAQPARMTSLHLDRPCTGAVEVAAVYRRGPRARALAARFERVPAAEPDDPRRWRCVTLRLL